MRIRTIAPAAMLAAAALAVGCGGDDEGSEESAATTQETAAQAEPAEKTIDFEVVERLTPEHLGKDPKCPPPGEWTASRDPLTTITPEAAKKAKTPPQSYGCGGRVDQVVFAEFESPAEAQELLDPANNSNATALVAGNTVVLVNFGVDEKIDIAAFFDAIKAECGCGETRYTES